MLDYPIPKLTLQPLVENAIYHGIQEKPEGGAISIEIVHETGDRIRISGFGMYNTNQRLRNYFGRESALRIESQFGEGTNVSFSINGNKRGEKAYD